jgi:hypothetical protein
MHQQIEAAERRIQFENLRNLNSLAVPSLILEMKERRTEEFVQKVYELYCDAWHTQGQKKSAAFLRAVYGGGILPVLRAQAGSITSEFAMFATRTNFPSQVRDATLQGLGLRMKRLEARWLRRIEAEAKECEHIDRRESSGVQSQAVDFSPTSVVLEVSGNAPEENSPASVQPVSAASVALGNAAIRIASGSTNPLHPTQQDTSANRGMSQVQPRPTYSALLSTFEVRVGKLMVQARRECPTKYLPQAEIARIAASLDVEKFPVRSNLEREAARTMAEHNQRHPTAAIKSWRTALSHPLFRRAVRKRFSRAEEKYKKSTPSVVVVSAGTPRTAI